MSHTIFSRPLLAAAVLCTLSACKGCGDDDAGQCTISYVRVEGEPSARRDTLHWDDMRSMTRVVRDNGEKASRAIYYLFDEDGNLSAELMDTDLDGELDARLDAGDLLGGLVTPYTVDALIEDQALDGVQLSIPLDGTMIGPWNPARLFFQIACDQGDVTARPTNDEQLTLDLDRTNDGEPDGAIAVQFGADGRLQTLTVDQNGDTRIDHVANVSYDDEGRVSEVFWTEPAQFFGNVYVVARYSYDRFGKLWAYELDADADGEFESRIEYSAGCHDYEGLR